MQIMRDAIFTFKSLCLVSFYFLLLYYPRPLIQLVKVMVVEIFTIDFKEDILNVSEFIMMFDLVLSFKKLSRT